MGIMDSPPLSNPDDSFNLMRGLAAELRKVQDQLDRLMTREVPLGGGVGISGTAAANQVAVWASATSIGGSSALTFDGTVLTTNITSATDPRGIMSAQYSTDTNAARVHLRKARGTLTVPTTVVSGDVLGQVRFSGYDGANFLQMGSIDVVSTGTIAATRVPTDMVFYTATDAAPSVLTEQLRIKTNGQLFTNDGAVSTPVYGFSGDTNTGAYRIGSDQYGIAAGGVKIVNAQLSGTTRQLTVGDGTNAAIVRVDGAAGAERGIRLFTNGTVRWLMRANSDAETGSDAGSNLEVIAFSDAGAVLSTPLQINRASGNVGLSTAPVTDTFLKVSGTRTMTTSAGSLVSVSGGDTTTMAANVNNYKLLVAGNWSTPAGSTNPIAAWLAILQSDPTGTGTISDATLLYLRAAPGGAQVTRGWTMWVDAGAARFDGNLDFSTSDTTNIVLGTGTGTKFGTATTQKLGFFNATPVVQEAGANDVLASLVTLGLRAASSNPPMNLGTGQLTAGAGVFSGKVSTSSATAGIGYSTGAGGTVTQLTNKGTGVTLNKSTGQITMNNATLNADTTVSFVLTNSAIAAGDILLVNHISGGTAGSYLLEAQSAAGTATIVVRNITTGNLGEAIVIAFAVIKAVTA